MGRGFLVFARLAVCASTVVLLATVVMVSPAEAQVRRGSPCTGLTATMYGTNGKDNLIGTEGDDVIFARGGDDFIDGRGGNDIICGGFGDDIIIGGPGDDTLYGWFGRDVLFGDEATCFDVEDLSWQSVFDCEPTAGGNDILRGGPYADFISGGGGADLATGGGGDDIMMIGPAFADEIDSMWGSGGNDSMYAFEGTARMDGGFGNDILLSIGGEPGTLHRLFGGFGNDDLQYDGSGDVDLFGGPGSDYAQANTYGGSIVFYGGDGDDFYDGNQLDAGAFTGYGGAGSDMISAPLWVTGPVVIDGGDGDDILGSVTGSTSIVRGRAGNDILVGRGLSGGDDDDRLFVIDTRLGGLLTRGGAGDDQILISREGSAVTEGNAGDDAIYADGGFSGTIVGGPGVDACGDRDGQSHDCEQPQSRSPFERYPVTVWVDIFWDVWPSDL